MTARTANATIYEIYQAISGATGEPGNWNGAEPARQYVATAEAQLASLTAERDEALALVNYAEDVSKTQAATIAALTKRVGELEGALEEAATLAAQFIDERLYKPKFPACSYHSREIYDAVRAVAACRLTGGEADGKPS